MKFGCALLDPQDLDAVKDIGYDYAEFMGKYLVSLSDGEYAALCKKLESLKLKVLGINGYCPPALKMAGPGFDMGSIKKYAKLCAGRAEALGASMVGIGSPQSRNLPKGYPRMPARRQLQEFLEITAEEFAVFDIEICLEPLAPCFCNFINFMPEAVSIIDEMKQNKTGIIADFYNMEHVGEADLDMKDFMPYISHVHISDDDGGPDKRSYLKPERARIHQERIQNLIKAGYQGAVSLEIDCRINPDRAAESLAIMKAADWEERERVCI